ncbi:antitoxin [Serratia nematodiphila DZ0503SBS1]|nr:antitoxin [Serratia nematodiphila DZ0503SBS1]
MSNANALLAFARETLEIELTEAQRLLARLDDNFVCACDLLLNCRGKAVISGIGKSGHIGKKIAASLASTGTRRSSCIRRRRCTAISA